MGRPSAATLQRRRAAQSRMLAAEARKAAARGEGGEGGEAAAPGAAEAAVVAAEAEAEVATLEDVEHCVVAAVELNGDAADDDQRGAEPREDPGEFIVGVDGEAKAALVVQAPEVAVAASSAAPPPSESAAEEVRASLDVDDDRGEAPREAAAVASVDPHAGLGQTYELGPEALEAPSRCPEELSVYKNRSLKGNSLRTQQRLASNRRELKAAAGECAPITKFFRPTPNASVRVAAEVGVEPPGRSR